MEAVLRRFEIVPMAGEAIAVAAARNFRSLRKRGVTVRKTMDLLIGTWCMENRRPLLHNDNDFRPAPRVGGSVNLIGAETGNYSVFALLAALFVQMLFRKRRA